MADADEDALPRTRPPNSSSSPSSAPADSDSEDELQDFRSIAMLTSKSTGASLLPRRGEKDFEPNPTQAQSNTLAASREAMHYALSAERVFLPRNPLVGQYLPDPRDWRWDVLPERRGGAGGKGGRCVVVESFNSTYSRSVGVTDYRNWTWLLPEEALFLLERGTLDIRWPDEEVGKFMKGSVEDEDGDKEDGDVDEAEDESVLVIGDGEKDSGATTKPKKLKVSLQVGTVPMSLQGAYASFVGKGGLTLEHYIVYAGLRRLGYIVQRAPTWDEGEDEDINHYSNGHAPEPNGNITAPLLPILRTTAPEPSSTNPALTLINRLVALFYTPKPLHYRPSTGPLIYPGLYGNYTDVFRALTLIPYYSSPTTQSTSPTSPAPTPRPPYTISWHVHKPNPNTQFRKSNPPPPDFRLAVLDARTTSIPTASEIDALLATMPRDELPKEKRMEMRLKHGVRNVILAVVDSGVVSYLRLADMCSGTEGRVGESRARGGKKGGSGGARRGGRGAARGGRR